LRIDRARALTPKPPISLKNQPKPQTKTTALVAWRNRRSTSLRVLAPVLFLLLALLTRVAIDANTRTENRVSALESARPGLIKPLPDCSEDLYSSATAGRPCLTFVFSPNTSAAATSVMRRVAERNSPHAVPASRYMGFASRKEADDYMVEAQGRGETVLGAVHFLATPDLSAGGGSAPRAPAATTSSGAASASFDPTTAFQYSIMTNTSGRYFRGVYQNPNTFFELPMQNAVAREATRELLGGDATPAGLGLSWRLSLSAFPHPRLTVVTLVEYIIAPFTFASCMFAFVAQLGSIVAEKESGLRQALRTMGMRDSAYWLSWLCFDAVMALATSLALVTSGVIMRFPMFVNNDFVLLLSLFWIFMQAMTGLAYALAAFVHRAQAAVYVGFMVFLTGWMLQGMVAAGLPYTPYFYHDKKGRVFFWAFNALPWNPLIKALLDLARAAPADASPGLRWSERFSYCQDHPSPAREGVVDPSKQYFSDDCVMGVGWVLVNEAVLALVYGLLAVYLDNVVANELGVRRPWLYFLDPGYWRPRPAAAGTALARVLAQEAAAVSAAAAGGAAAAAAAAARRSSLGGLAAVKGRRSGPGMSSMGGGIRQRASAAGGGTGGATATNVVSLRRLARRYASSARRAASRVFCAATGAGGGGATAAANAPRPPPLADHVLVDEDVALEEAKMRQLLYARGSAALAAARARSSDGGGGSGSGSGSSAGGGRTPPGKGGSGGGGGHGGKQHAADHKHGAFAAGPGRFGAARDDAELAAAFEALQRSGAAALGGFGAGAAPGAANAPGALLPQGSIGIVQARVTVAAPSGGQRPAAAAGAGAGAAAAVLATGRSSGGGGAAGAATLTRRGGSSSGGGARTTGSGGGVIVPLEAIGLSPDDDDGDGNDRPPARSNGSGYAVELYGLRRVFHQRAHKGLTPAAAVRAARARGAAAGGKSRLLASLRERVKAVLRAFDSLLRRAGLRRPLERLNSGDALEAGSPSAAAAALDAAADGGPTTVALPPGVVVVGSFGGALSSSPAKTHNAAASAAADKRRKNEFWAVRGSWFGIREGELFCLLGPNGAGKTTTINCLTGALPVTGGEALIYGHPIACGATGMDRVRQLMGVCPQFDVQWNELTGREHLQIYGHVKGVKPSLVNAQATHLLEKVALGKAAKTRSAAYSGGMRRRLSVAIALLGDPKIVYLDEPTTGMDPISRRYVWDIIQEAKKGRAIVLTTHSMEEADVLGDRIGIMARGRLQAVGSSLRLKQKFGAGYQVSVAVGGGLMGGGSGSGSNGSSGPAAAGGSSASATAAAMASAFSAASAAAVAGSAASSSSYASSSSSSADATALVSDPIAGPFSAYASLVDRSAPVRALFRARLDVDPLTDEAAGGTGGDAPATSGRYLHWLVPRDREPRLAEFLSELEARGRELNVTDVQLSLTSLEEVFLTISRRAEIEAAKGQGRGTVAVPVPAPLGGGSSGAVGGRVLEVPLGEERVVDSVTGAAYAIKWAMDEHGRLVVLDVRRVGVNGGPAAGGGGGLQRARSGAKRASAAAAAAAAVPASASAPALYSTTPLVGGGDSGSVPPSADGESSGGGANAGGPPPVRVASVAATPLSPRTLGVLRSSSGALVRGNSLVLQPSAPMPPPPPPSGGQHNQQHQW
jgi:ABC-type multidrug transport system ATPase subunit